MSADNQHRQLAPQVSVLMPVYNGEAYLSEAIDSILAQTFSDFEFIIVDDGSQDNSAEIIRDYAQRDERIRFFQHGVNRGRSSALNTGLAEARGEYIALMDADDISLPKRFKTQVDFLHEHPEIGVLGSAIEVTDDQLARKTIWVYPERHAFIVCNLVFFRVWSRSCNLHDAPCMPSCRAWLPGKCAICGRYRFVDAAAGASTVRQPS